MKPMLFNTEMVCALLDNRKTVTRRVVKPRYCDSVFEMFRGQLYEASPYKPPIDNGNGTTTRFVRQFVPCKSPYRPSDILYVREAFQQNYDGSYSYRAGHKFEKEGGWRPSIHMPKEAARIFLRVINVRVERLQDINERGPLSAVSEGFTNDINLYSGAGKSATKHFVECWDSTIKPADHALYGWDANPWVWVIKFKQISREEALSDR